MSKTSVQFTGVLPVRLRRELREDEELTFPVTARVASRKFDVETGEEVITFRIVRAQEPTSRRWQRELG